jgi:hypothetical protein
MIALAHCLLARWLGEVVGLRTLPARAGPHYALAPSSVAAANHLAQ